MEFDVLSDIIAESTNSWHQSATEVSLGEASLRTGVNRHIEARDIIARESADEQKRPIIYALPYTSIIETNPVYRTNRDGGVQKRTPPILGSETEFASRWSARPLVTSRSRGLGRTSCRTDHRQQRLVRRYRRHIEHVNISVDSAPRVRHSGSPTSRATGSLARPTAGVTSRRPPAISSGRTWSITTSQSSSTSDQTYSDGHVIRFFETWRYVSDDVRVGTARCISPKKDQPAVSTERHCDEAPVHLCLRRDMLHRRRHRVRNHALKLRRISVSLDEGVKVRPAVHPNCFELLALSMSTSPVR